MGEDVPLEYDRKKLEEKCSVYEFISKHYGSDAYKLIELFSKLNSIGKAKAIEELSDMVQLSKYTDMERLGHKNIKTTLQTYTFNTDVMQNTAVDIFEQSLQA